MTDSIQDYVELKNRVETLNCVLPATMCFLPENIDNAATQADFIFPEETQTISKLFKANNLPEEKLTLQPARYRQRRSIDWFAPTIFVGYSLWTQNPEIMSVALNVLSNYITDFFKGSFGEKKMKLDIVVETHENTTFKKIRYEGTPEGLKHLKDMFKNI